MRLGVSSYSYSRSMATGRLALPDVVDLVADSDADHLEIAAAPDLPEQPEVVAALRDRAADRGVELAGYVVGADFRSDDPAVVREAVDGVVRHLETAHALGIPRLRHDVVAWAWRDRDHAEFERTLAHVVPLCRRIADRAADLGMTTMVENHGFAFNNSERIRRLVHEVDHPAFRTLLDVGNFVCVDEDPLQAVQLTLPIAAVVHLKDFLVRQAPPSPEGWLRTLAGRAVLGTVVGHGDLPMARLVELVVASGFDGPVSIEFEGLEDDVAAVTTGIATVRHLAAELRAG